MPLWFSCGRCCSHSLLSPFRTFNPPPPRLSQQQLQRRFCFIRRPTHSNASVSSALVRRQGSQPPKRTQLILRTRPPPSSPPSLQHWKAQLHLIHTTSTLLTRWPSTTTLLTNLRLGQRCPIDSALHFTFHLQRAQPLYLLLQLRSRLDILSRSSSYSSCSLTSASRAAWRLRAMPPSPSRSYVDLVLERAKRQAYPYVRKRRLRFVNPRAFNEQRHSHGQSAVNHRCRSSIRRA